MMLRPPSSTPTDTLFPDTTLFRSEDLSPFAAKHDMKIGTIADLIAFRRKSEMLVERVASGPFVSHYGDDFTIHVYRDTIEGGEHVALTRGTIGPDSDTLEIGRAHV